MFGVFVCGMKNLRIWFGPLPIPICLISVISTNITVFSFGTFIMMLISLAKFMFICKWKCMPQMDDDLIARFGVVWATFMSVWLSISIALTSPKWSGNRKCLCNGDFSELVVISNWEELVGPKSNDTHR